MEFKPILSNNEFPASYTPPARRFKQKKGLYLFG
jgi:hypothetical protein